VFEQLVRSARDLRGCSSQHHHVPVPVDPDALQPQLRNSDASLGENFDVQWSYVARNDASLVRITIGNRAEPRQHVRRLGLQEAADQFGPSATGCCTAVSCEGSVTPARRSVGTE